MKNIKLIPFLILFLTFGYNSQAQIQYTGCNGVITGGPGLFPMTLTANGTTNDGGTIRNTYESPVPGPGCSAGTCSFKVEWNIGANQWEIILNSSIILYVNTSASFPNPPDLTLGTWVAQGPCGGQAISTWTGDVQSSVGGSAPEINLLGNGNSITDGDVAASVTDDTDFGSINLGANNPHTFTIDNTAGTAALNVTTIPVTGANAGDFVVGGITLPANIAAGASTTFTLTFTPGAVGVRNATVTVNNDDADEAVYDFAVRGTGVGVPEINMIGNGNSITDGDVAPSVTDDTDFGNITNAGNNVHTFTIDNTAGTAALNVTTIPVTGANAGDFVVSGITLPANVATGASTTFTLTFTPSAVAVRNATVTVNSNDANEAAYDFAVRGTGIAGLPSCITFSAPVGTTNTWMGCVDDDWSNGLNWSLGVAPTPSDVIYVPANASNPLIINEVATCAKMIVEIGGVCRIDYNAGGKLVVEF